MSGASVLMIGGVPGPSGGVTVFLGRLINRIGDQIAFEVLDQHAGTKEPSLARAIRIAPAGRLRKHVWIYAQALWPRTAIVHFNYSSPKALLMLALLPKFGRRFVVTLHNGAQCEPYTRQNALLRALIRAAAARADCVTALCDDHVAFYRLLGVPAQRVLALKSQIPPPAAPPAYVDQAHQALRARSRHLVVASGHVERSYCFDYVLDYVRARPGCAALFFFYGKQPDQVYLEQLRGAASDLPVLFYFHQSEAVFLSALRTADAYLRPTLVDSWGIAVADAILMGIPAVASSVCERFPGAFLCAPGEPAAFVAATDAALAAQPAGAAAPYDAAPLILAAYRALAQGRFGSARHDTA